MSGDGAWWDAAFGPEYLAVYAHRDQASAESEAAFAADRLGIVRGTRVLDAACGAGRHAHALAGRGARVVGVDRSDALLRAAAGRDRAETRETPRFVRGDLRALPFRAGAFERVVSFFTSFGYFDERGDRTQLSEFRRVLVPGGAVLLDFLNAPRVASALVLSSERVVEGRTVREERAIRRGRVEKSVEVVLRGAVVARWRESVRLYERDEVAALLRDAGFHVLAEHGDLTGAPWSATADRLVVTARVG